MLEKQGHRKNRGNSLVIAAQRAYLLFPVQMRRSTRLVKLGVSGALNKLAFSHQFYV